MKLYKTLIVSACLAIAIISFSCTENEGTPKVTPAAKKQPKQRNQPPAFTYAYAKTKEWFKANDSLLTPQAMNILQGVNRTDAAHLKALDSVLVPTSFAGDLEFYMHFPMTVPALEQVEKIILFSYPTQTFAAYNYGELEYSGPTNMGRRNNPTPQGLYFCNWKAEETISTVDDEWLLKWNFNIQNKEGIGFHQYELPGYPASHSCLRLREADAKKLYNWAEQWKLKGTDDILAKGTPVIVFGEYPFGQAKPWSQLVGNPTALDMQAAQIAQVVQPHLPEILKAQQQRMNYQQQSAKDSL